MKKLTVAATLIGVLVLSACSSDEEEAGVQEPGGDQNQVEEDGMDDAGGKDTEDDTENTGDDDTETEEDTDSETNDGSDSEVEDNQMDDGSEDTEDDEDN